MGLIIDITPRVSVELRRESFVLSNGDDEDPSTWEQAEYAYTDAQACYSALDRVLRSDRYLDHMGRVLAEQEKRR
jgi:hypothetical protein